jgi:vesicle transport protein SEC22
MKDFENTRSEENINKINNELFEIQGILNKNMEMLMNRQKNLEDIGKEANILREGSERMKANAEKTKLQMQMRKYMLFIILGGLMFLFIIFKFFF